MRFSGTCVSWIWCLTSIRCVWGSVRGMGEGGWCGATGLTGSRGQVYAILDEVFLAGEIEETSKQVVLTRLEHLDKLE